MFGVDDLGEIWILAGDPNPRKYESCVPICINGDSKIEKLLSPICTNEMRRRRAKVIDFYPSKSFCIAKIEYLYEEMKQELVILTGKRVNIDKNDHKKEDRLLEDFAVNFEKQFS